MRPTQEKLEALRAAHGRVLTLDVDDGEHQVVFKRASAGEYKRLQKRLMDDEGDKPGALADFARACIVYPEGKELLALLDEYPGVADKVSADAVKLARGEAAKHAKKYEP